MENYVLLYHFDNGEAQKRFEEKINRQFERHQEDVSNRVKYFGFAEREEPAVVDKLNSILRPMQIGTGDYVALYHSPKQNPDKITRTMLLGHDEFVENDVRDLTSTAHQVNLDRLLGFDYVKAEQKNRASGK
jgi:hypothetical protein